ncbi:hypothetical protein GXN76_12510 [Kroppenstedtia pulmonis]|uniref:Uncharacterized protein n=1 Tax=Kroppenstedtia pulmonis TaxID=1380685 RepID=A0A7D4BGP2_9BACL|nr:hypothetical protein [Kroppenstedtia pulmonis]QKG85212.1 hypothetical protein GXN76_12510 [Kroppenstedtia pulmonis]
MQGKTGGEVRKKIMWVSGISLVFAFFFSLLTIPSTVLLDSEGAKGEMDWVHLSPALYWMNIVGMTVWIAILTSLFCLLVSLMVILFRYVASRR